MWSDRVWNFGKKEPGPVCHGNPTVLGSRVVWYKGRWVLKWLLFFSTSALLRRNIHGRYIEIQSVGGHFPHNSWSFLWIPYSLSKGGFSCSSIGHTCFPKSCWPLNSEWLLCLSTRSNLVWLHVFLVCVVGATHNRIPIKYSCSIKRSNRIRHVCLIDVVNGKRNQLRGSSPTLILNLIHCLRVGCSWESKEWVGFCHHSCQLSFLANSLFFKVFYSFQ